MGTFDRSYPKEHIAVFRELRDKYNKKVDVTPGDIESLEKLPDQERFLEWLQRNNVFNSRPSFNSANEPWTINDGNLNAIEQVINWPRNRPELSKSFSEGISKWVFGLHPLFRIPIVTLVCLGIVVMVFVLPLLTIIGEENRDRFLDPLLSKSEVALFPPVEVDELKCIVDLGEWKPKGVPEANKAKWTWIFQCRRTHPDTKVLAYLVPSSSLSASSTNHIVKKQKDTKRGSSSSNKLVTLNIREEPLHDLFQTDIQTTEHKVFGNASKSAVEAIVLHPTRRLIVDVTFPSTKPPTAFRRFDELSGSRTPVTTATGFKQMGSLQSFWSIDHPKVGHTYILEWDW